MIRWNIKEINNKKLHKKITITQYMTKIIVILRYSLNFIDEIFAGNPFHQKIFENKNFQL